MKNEMKKNDMKDGCATHIGRFCVETSLNMGTVFLSNTIYKDAGSTDFRVLGENLSALCNSRPKRKRNHEVWSYREEGPGLHCLLS